MVHVNEHSSDNAPMATDREDQIDQNPTKTDDDAGDSIDTNIMVTRKLPLQVYFYYHIIINNVNNTFRSHC